MFPVTGKALFPGAWRGFVLVFRSRPARYDIAVVNPHGQNRGVARVELDGTVLMGARSSIPPVDDGATHLVRVTLG